MKSRPIWLAMLAATLSLSACQTVAPPQQPIQQQAPQSGFTLEQAKSMADFAFDAGSEDGASLVFGMQNIYAGQTPGDRHVMAFKQQVASYKLTLLLGDQEAATFDVNVEGHDHDMGDGVAKVTVYNLKAGNYKLKLKAYDDQGHIVSEGGRDGQLWPEGDKMITLSPHTMTGAQEKDPNAEVLPWLADLNWSTYVPLMVNVRLLEDYAMIPGAGITENINAIEKYTKKDLAAEWTHNQSRRAKSAESLPILFDDDFFDDQSNLNLGLAALDNIAVNKPTYVVFTTDGKGEGPAYQTSGPDVVTVVANDPNNGLPLNIPPFAAGMNRTMTVKVSPNQYMDFYFNFNGDLKGVSVPYGGATGVEDPSGAFHPDQFRLVDPELGDHLEKYYSSYTGADGKDAKYVFMQDENGTIISMWVDPTDNTLLGLTIPSASGDVLTHVQLQPTVLEQ
jgi:hypothetical protein